MKKIILIILILSICEIAEAQLERSSKVFNIEGKILGESGKILYLSYCDSLNRYRTDSTKIHDGDFKFSGTLTKETNAYIKSNVRFKYGPNLLTDSLRLVLVPGKSISAIVYTEFYKR